MQRPATATAEKATDGPQRGRGRRWWCDRWSRSGPWCLRISVPGTLGDDGRREQRRQRTRQLRLSDLGGLPSRALTPEAPGLRRRTNHLPAHARNPDARQPDRGAARGHIRTIRGRVDVDAGVVPAAQYYKKISGGNLSRLLEVQFRPALRGCGRHITLGTIQISANAISRFITRFVSRGRRWVACPGPGWGFTVALDPAGRLRVRSGAAAAPDATTVPVRRATPAAIPTARSIRNLVPKAGRPHAEWGQPVRRIQLHAA